MRKNNHISFVLVYDFNSWSSLSASQICKFCPRRLSYFLNTVIGYHSFSLFLFLLKGIASSFDDVPLKHILSLHKKMKFSIKVRLLPSKKDFFICVNHSLSKMMKNSFYFILKALFVLKIFKLLSWLFGHVEKKG